MAGVAVAIILLLAVAIYSLSRLSTNPWASRLMTPHLQSSSRQDLPHFEYKIGGKELTSQNLEGHWTLISFWSYTCEPCLVELPGLNQLFQNWQGQPFEALTINVDQSTDDKEQARKYLVDNEITLPTIYDRDQKIKNIFQVDQYPRHFLVTPDLKIVWSATGAFSWNESKVRDQLSKLMEPQDSDLEQEQEQSPDQPE
jgi:cytochrome oxidase Cu insertion factor (SCO1/SenC/PrrC family)